METFDHRFTFSQFSLKFLIILYLQKVKTKYSEVSKIYNI